MKLRPLALGSFKGFLCVLCGSAAIFAAPGAQAQAGHVDVLVAEDAVTTPLYNYIQRGIQTAEADGAQALIIQLNTPGGLVDSMQQIVEAIGQSKVPVVVYVAPRSARAASAGALIVMAGHAAAMSPETVIGAASPIDSSGQDLTQTVETKLKEVLKAQVRTLGARRGAKAVQLGEEMVESARAVSEQEALEAGLIDFIAADMDDLLEQLDGFEVQVQGRPIRLSTAGASVKTIESNIVENLLRVILNPNISFLLLTIGVQAILIELSSPGGWVAGFIGAVCLVLFVYSAGVIPVNALGLVLIGIAFVLFFLEVKAPTHGALMLTGLATFIAGALVLFNTTPGPEQAVYGRLSVPLVIGTGVVTALFFGFIVGKALQAQRRPAVTGVESLVGRHGMVQTDLVPRGTVHVFGELWTAEAEGETLPAGTRIEVVGSDGLTLRVQRAQPPDREDVKT
ncbi:MAG: nodulation protein NfeD [Thermoflexales bacterium]|nr:nodulation protein NfeD [Thermoflexales bacterium]